MVPAGLPALQNAIRHLYAVESTFVESVPVTLRVLGDVLWDREVQVFDLPPGSLSPRAYAWSYLRDTTGEARQFVAILHSPYIESPVKAVQAYLVKAVRDAKRGR